MAVTILLVGALAFIVAAIQMQVDWPLKVSKVLILMSTVLVGYKAVLDIVVWLYERWRNKDDPVLPRRRWVLDHRSFPESPAPSPRLSTLELPGSMLKMPTAVGRSTPVPLGDDEPAKERQGTLPAMGSPPPRRGRGVVPPPTPLKRAHGAADVAPERPLKARNSGSFDSTALVEGATPTKNRSRRRTLAEGPLT
eukprot:gene48505-44513_t